MEDQGTSSEQNCSQILFKSSTLQFKNAVVLNAAGRRNAQMNAQERKWAEKGAHASPQESANEHKSLGTPKVRETRKGIRRSEELKKAVAVSEEKIQQRSRRRGQFSSSRFIAGKIPDKALHVEVPGGILLEFLKWKGTCLGTWAWYLCKLLSWQSFSELLESSFGVFLFCSGGQKESTWEHKARTT